MIVVNALLNDMSTREGDSPYSHYELQWPVPFEPMATDESVFIRVHSIGEGAMEHHH